MRRIALVETFFQDKHIEQINEAAEKNGFKADLYTDGMIPEEKLNDYEIVYGLPRRGQLKKMENLKWFHCSFAGVNLYSDKNLYLNTDCILSNSTGAYGLTISEHIIMVTLMLFRNMADYQKMVDERKWTIRGGDMMRSIYGSSITVLGTGDIGTSFAQRAKAFSPSIIRGVKRTMGEADAAFDEVYTFEEIDKILPVTDLLVMALPSTPLTRKIISGERIAMLPENAVIVNVGRGDAIDQDALMEALNKGKIAGAALDVVEHEPLDPSSPLWDTKNLLITPHCAGNVTLQYTMDQNVEIFCNELENYTNGKPNTHKVEFEKGY